LSSVPNFAFDKLPRFQLWKVQGNASAFSVPVSRRRIALDAALLAQSSNIPGIIDPTPYAQPAQSLLGAAFFTDNRPGTFRPSVLPAPLRRLSCMALVAEKLNVLKNEFAAF
jgi:hypothetical protein